MAKVDLHVHSKYSSHASEWFLKRLGASESYTEPEEVYRRAKEKGMAFVTLTDHNKIEGALLLKERHPEDVFTGVEATAYFPEDGCKIHILLFGLTAREFETVDTLRRDIYALREYIYAQDIAYAVAHAWYDVNDRLTRPHLEKLILLFDIFEGLNGSEDQVANRGWMELLQSLTPRHIQILRERHGITPLSKDPWVKGFTAGSDDHAAMYIGDTYTQAGAKTPEEFLFCLKNKLTRPAGRHNDYQSFVFSIYKIAFEFLQNKNSFLAHSLLSRLNDSLFNNRRMSWLDRLKMALWRPQRARQAMVKRLFLEFYESMQQLREKQLDDKLQSAYTKISDLTDGLFQSLLQTLDQDASKGDVARIFQDFSAILPGIFLTIPFFSSLKHLFRGRHLLREMRQDLLPEFRSGERRILWFTDTLTDMNGAAVSIQEATWMADPKQWQVTVAAPLNPEEPAPNLPGLVKIPYIHSFTLPFYPALQLKVPSVLKALELIYRARPHEIIISTPGPMGLLGLLAAKLLNVKASGIYHTDFPAQVLALTSEEDFTAVLQNYLRWFYGRLDAIKVPSLAYRDRLRDLGYPEEKIAFYRKALDTELFAPRPLGIKSFRAGLPFPDAPVLLYAGRISKDKNLEFLFRIFAELSGERPLNWVLAGDGPDLPEFRRRAGKHRGIVFVGRKERRQLPEFYSSADVFVFPSVTDTFGMAVLEAQACGLPAVVSDQGGPREIVVHRKTGLIAAADNAEAWKKAIRELLDLKVQQPNQYQKMKWCSRQNVVEYYRWDQSLALLFEQPAKAFSGLKAPKKEFAVS